MKRKRQVLCCTVGALLLMGIVVAVTSCRLDFTNFLKFEKVPMLPVLIPGAEYVGMEACEQCHPKKVKDFKKATHSQFDVKAAVTGFEAPVLATGCETCHGPASIHIQEEHKYDRTKILAGTPKQCFQCHIDKQMQFRLQYHHPVPEGRMMCTACHNPHGTESMVSLIRGPNERCFKCHKEQRGPFIFEHDAVREGCQVCHNPHGSINRKMLVQNPDVLCFKCHFEYAFNANVPGGGQRLGRRSHAGYFMGAGMQCIDHHRAPHGSNFRRQLKSR